MKTRAQYVCSIVAFGSAAAAAITASAEAPPEGAASATYFRENSLALCEWGGDRSFAQFIDDAIGSSTWTCRAPPTPNDDSCSYNFGRPTDPMYTLLPRDIANNWGQDLLWQDGSAMYNAWSIRCGLTSESDSLVDTLVDTTVEGHGLPPTDREPCDLKGPMHYPSILAEVDGSIVQHVRPALVRARVVIARPVDYKRVLFNDVTVAIQTYAAAGWEDRTIVSGQSLQTARTFELQATIPPGEAVRLQVRATHFCQSHPGVGYDLRSARIQVETCIPDQSDPNMCLD